MTPNKTIVFVAKNLISKIDLHSRCALFICVCIQNNSSFPEKYTSNTFYFRSKKRLTYIRIHNLSSLYYIDIRSHSETIKFLDFRLSLCVPILLIPPVPTYESPKFNIESTMCIVSQKNRKTNCPGRRNTADFHEPFRPTFKSSHNSE